MNIKVSSTEAPDNEQSLDVYSLTYNFKSAAFEMSAGGYLIPSHEAFKPVSFHVQWTTLFVRFVTEQEAMNFCEWLKGANEQAERSFTRMLD
jgi:hypothetical protein